MRVIRAVRGLKRTATNDANGTNQKMSKELVLHKKRSGMRRGPLLWLAARSRRFWLCIGLLQVLYVLSFGPACWLIWYIGIAPPQPNPPMRAADWIGLLYAPCVQIVRRAGEHHLTFIELSLSWYAGLGIPEGEPVLIPLSPHTWLQGRDGFDGDE